MPELETAMKRKLFSLFLLLIVFSPLISFSDDMKWSGVLYMKGTGATNCGKPRITNEAWDRCEEWARKSIKGDQKPNIKDIELYNIAVENDKGPSWNPKLNCNFRASVKCGYRLEKISAAEKLKLSKIGKLKKTDTESCGEPVSTEEIAQSDCEAGKKNKKPVVAEAKTESKPSAAPPQINPVAAAVFSKMMSAAMAQNTVKAQRAEAAPDSDTAIVAAVSKKGLKWSGQISIKGDGITNCGASRINNDAWETCDAWAAQKKGKKGFEVKPEVKDLNISDIKVVTGKPAGNDPNPSCSFEAKVKCGYSTAAAYVVGGRSAGATTETDKGRRNTHNLDDLFGDGLRWSSLIGIEGVGISNCGKSRIHNEAWEKCEAWAEQQKKKQDNALKPVIKNVELYNIASENEKGPSWEPKQSCSFHATLKCGYRME
jgi:hypothetical protein